MVGFNRPPEDLLEIIDREFQIALGDGDVGVSQRLLHKVNIARPEVFLQSEGATETVW